MKALNDGTKYLDHIFNIVNKNKSSFTKDNPIQWVEKIITELGLDKSGVNPLVTKSFISCLELKQKA